MTTISTEADSTAAQDSPAVVNPFSGHALRSVKPTAPADLSKIVAGARLEAASWGHTRLTDRQLVYRQFVTDLRQRRDTLADLLTAETGQPVTDSRSELEQTAGYFSDTTGESNAFYGHVYPHGAEAITASFLQYTVNEPLGVVAVVMDEEAPALSFAFQVASTLLMGNVVLVCPSPATPLTVLELVRMLHEAGVPPAALQVVTGGPDIVRSLVSSPQLNGLNIHGSSEQAIEATQAARRNLTRVVALGHSNDVIIVFDDADLDVAAAETARAGFTNAGQNRAAPKRVLVQESVLAQFTDRLVTHARELVPGDPTEESTRLGTLTTEACAVRAEQQVEQAIARGAVLLVGGRRDAAAFAATVLQLPNAQDPLARDEVIRGPVLALTAFANDQEAFDIAAASPYGFGAGVFTSNLGRAGSAATRLEVSTVVINGAGDHRSRRTPLGGVKRSGVGTESLLATPRETTEVKTILAADVYDFTAVNEDNVAGRHT